MAASAIAPMLAKLGSSSKNVTEDQLNDSSAVLLTLSNNRRLAQVFYEADTIQASVKFMRSHSIKRFGMSYECLLLLMGRVASENEDAANAIIKNKGLELVHKCTYDKRSNRRLRSHAALMLLGIAVHPNCRLATCGSRTLGCIRELLDRAVYMASKRPRSQQSSSKIRIRQGDITAGNGGPARPSTVASNQRHLEADQSSLLAWSCCAFLWYASSHASCRLPIVRAGLTKSVIHFAESGTVDIIEKFERQDAFKYNEEFFNIEHKAEVDLCNKSRARMAAAGCLWNLARDTIARSVVTELKGSVALMRIVEGVVTDPVHGRKSIAEMFDEPEKNGLHLEIMYIKKNKAL
jgi:hypothetical protein